MIKFINEAISIYDGYGIYVENDDESFIIWSRDLNDARRAANYISKLTKDPYFDPYEESDSLYEVCSLIKDDLFQTTGAFLEISEVDNSEISDDTVMIGRNTLIHIIKYFEF